MSQRDPLGRHIALAGAAAIAVPLAAAHFTRPTPAPEQAPLATQDRAPVRAALGGVTFDFSRRDRAWVDDFAGLRREVFAQHTSSAVSGGQRSGGDIADASAATTPADGPDMTTTGSVSPREGTVPGPAPAKAAPPAAPAPEPVPQATRPAPGTEATRPQKLILPPVPDPVPVPARVIEGRRPITIVQVPEGAAEAHTAPMPDARQDAPAAQATPATIAAAAAQAAHPAPTEAPPRKTASAEPAAAPAPAAPSAAASAMGGLAPAPWLKITAAVPTGAAATRPTPARKAQEAAAHEVRPATPVKAEPTAMLGYAAASRSAEAPFDAVLGVRRPDGGEAATAGPKLPPNLHGWAYSPLPASVSLPKEQKCLAEAIYFEARGESERGQAAVAQVVLNRVKNPAYPDTICGVVYQQEDDRNRCQFSFACDGRPEAINEPEAWKRAVEIAREVTEGRTYVAEVGDSTHYHADWVAPGWRRGMTRLTKIGVHVFYRTVHGGWI
ncbi:cell wall hydrolase [Prosthecomicrobium sp. N25]|uniref:cell wall hydrolase n=1 Tax=Prosthecomicrobium sp. N25 TaxID=3129254 RepID=UPI00307786D5